MVATLVNPTPSTILADSPYSYINHFAYVDADRNFSARFMQLGIIAVQVPSYKEGKAVSIDMVSMYRYSFLGSFHL